jgi:hypothetical protein
MTDFDQNLKQGKLAESKIIKWLIKKGWYVLPTYESSTQFKGPRLFGKEELVAPDAIIMKVTEVQPDEFSAEKVRSKQDSGWAEVKEKSVATWHHNTNTLEDGIDLDHFKDYCKVERSTGIPVYFFILHAPTDKIDGGAPDYVIPPSGLFVAKLSFLRNHGRVYTGVNNYGKGGMIYFPVECFEKLATWEEMGAL